MWVGGGGGGFGGGRGELKRIWKNSKINVTKVRAQTIYEKIDSYVYVFPFSLNTKNSDCVMSAEGRQK